MGEGSRFVFQTTSMSDQKKLYIIAGCNGAGKTTASRMLLPNIKFINADIIAFELNPTNVAEAAMEAGRIMLNTIDELMYNGESFAFETTLSAKIYKHKIQVAKVLGYQVHLIFFWLNSVDLAIERVKTRVMQGGHTIENHIIRRRYKRGIYNLLNIYIPLVDQIMVFDNSGKFLEEIAEQNSNNHFLILNFEKWNKLIKS